MQDQLGEQLIRAAAANDFEAAAALLAPDVEFRGLTPGRMFEAGDRDAFVAILEAWFAPVRDLETVEGGIVVDRPSVRYRVRIAEGGEQFVFEQNAYYDVADGLISKLHLVCSGDRPVVAAP